MSLHTSICDGDDFENDMEDMNITLLCSVFHHYYEGEHLQSKQTGGKLAVSIQPLGY